MSLDHRAFDLLHRRAGELGLVDWFLVGCARLGSTGAVLVMLWVGARRGRRGRRALARCLLAVATIHRLCELAGWFVARPRPFAAATGARALIQHGAERSFPSRHVASATAMALALRPASRGASVLLVAIAAGLGIGRVRAGLHYPSDVLAGIVLGSVIGLGLRGKNG